MTAIGRSGLETPSYMFMSVFAFFVILSIIIHKAIEFISHCLSKQKRNGLKTAFKTMINEVMLLGFISLILTLIEESVSKICIDKKYYNSHWIPMDYVSDCDSCFRNTRRLSAEFRKVHEHKWHKHCLGKDDVATGVNATAEALHGEPHDDRQGDHHEEPNHYMNAQRRLLSGDLGHGNPCHGDEVQLISAKALHEVHTLIFLLAVFHVLVVVLMVLVATYRLRRWKQWKKEDDAKLLTVVKRTWTIQVEDKKDEPPASAEANQQTPLLSHQIPPLSEGEIDTEAQIPGSSQQPSATETQEESEREDTENVAVLEGLLKVWRTSRNKRTTTAQNGASTSEGQKRVDDSAGRTPGVVQSVFTRCRSSIQLKDTAMASEEQNERPEIDVSAANQEWKAAFWKQFYKPISKDEFRILRCAFLTEHRASDRFDFEEYLLKSLDDDISKVVEIPNAGWAAVIVGYTLWAPTHFSAWPILAALILIEITVIVVSTKLVTIVRLLTANGQVHKLKPDAFWRKDPRLLLPLIRIALFVDSFVFPLFLAVAWQYGVQSCALVGSIANDAWIHQIAVPLIVVINVLCFIHVSWILMPLYSVTVHMSSTHFSRHLLDVNVQVALYGLLGRIRKPAKELHRLDENEEEQSLGLLASGLH